MSTICDEIDEYIASVRANPDAYCKEQHMLVDFVENAFRTEKIRVDLEQLARYLKLQEFFPYKLLPWEKFVFTLHNCTYDESGELRFPILFLVVGRGAGKNGYLAFEDFCLLTPVNGVRNYDIDIFATSEDQAKATFGDIHDILERNRAEMKQYFRWTQEEIKNLRTNSRLKYHTSAPGTKDGGRPGKVDFDEYHAYKDKKLIKVAITGLGKKRHPRRTIMTTLGDIRDGPCDEALAQGIQILQGVQPDNGTLPVIYRLDADSEITNKSCWVKANPSLPYFPTLRREIELEFAEYIVNPAGNADFATKRMNRPQTAQEEQICTWDNVLATNELVPDLRGRQCICGIDYTLLSDFAAIGLLFKVKENYYWITHSWVCRNSRDFSRIKFPVSEAAKKGLLTIVDDVEIRPELLIDWMVEKSRLYDITWVCCDTFRYALLRAALEKIGFRAGKGGNIWLTRISDIVMVAPVIISAFAKEKVKWGDNMLMRWYTWNVKQVHDKGNVRFEKIEPKSRKTDGFFAFAHAMTKSETLPQNAESLFVQPIVWGDL